MNAVQTRHMKLWFAGKAFNWELATYELRLGPGSRSLRSLVRDDRNTTARRGFNFQTAKRIASASGYPVRRSGAIDYQRLWNTGSSAFADDDNGMRHSPRPACGERSRASCERVRGILDRLGFADTPPHPDTSPRSVSDLSPQAGRGEASPWSHTHLGILATNRSSSSLRKQGPIRRAAPFERRCSMTFAQQLRPVVMGPRVREDDAAARHACAFSRRETARALPTVTPRNKIRAWGMPGARCTRSLACKIKKHTR